jgi:plastocyanin
MAGELRPGTRVSWSTPQGRTHGVIVRKTTEPVSIENFEVKASTSDPRYIVRSEQSGKLAAHRPSALRVLKAR